MDVVQEKCTTINVAYLEAIIEHYKMENTKTDITFYKLKVDIFCQDVKLSVCKNEDFMPDLSSLLKCENIGFVLEWKMEQSEKMSKK